MHTSAYTRWDPLTSSACQLQASSQAKSTWHSVVSQQSQTTNVSRWSDGGMTKHMSFTFSRRDGRDYNWWANTVAMGYHNHHDVSMTTCYLFYYQHATWQIQSTSVHKCFVGFHCNAVCVTYVMKWTHVWHHKYCRFSFFVLQCFSHFLQHHWICIQPIQSRNSFIVRSRGQYQGRGQFQCQRPQLMTYIQRANKLVNYTLISST